MTGHLLEHLMHLALGSKWKDLRSFWSCHRSSGVESRIDDHEVMFALRGASGIREGSGAAGTAKSTFCGRTFPNQSSFRFRHGRSVLYMRSRLCLLFRTLSFFPRRILSGLLATFANLIQRRW